MEKPAVTSRPINELLANRWSPRAFEPGGTINTSQIQALCEAARWSPSCFGEEPWAFVVCSKTDAAAWDKAFSCLREGNKWWAQNAAALILICAKTRFVRNNDANRHYAYDTGAAALAMVLQAEAEGFRAHQMGGFDPGIAREVFSVPDDCECMAMMAVGAQAPPDAIADDEKRTMETAPRRRKPLSENFFAANWGEPLRK